MKGVFFRGLGIATIGLILFGCAVPQPQPKPKPPASKPAPPTSQKPPPSVEPILRGEMRGIWLRDPRGRDWDKVMRDLKTAGFNTLFVNFATGGAAFYPSKIVSQISQRDEAALCLAAGKRHGIAVHAKLICFFTYLSPQSFQRDMLRKHLELRGTDGKPYGEEYWWLDPLLKSNRDHIVALAREILQRYDVDGLQLDYIRQPELGVQVSPQQTAAVEEVVQRVREDMRRLRPGKPLSAAVFHDIARARNQMAQDWPGWAKRRLVDFVCPMNYTTDNAKLATMLNTQRFELRNTVPIYTGIAGYKFMEINKPDELAAQIALARQWNPEGFVVFAYDEDFVKKGLPKLQFENKKPPIKK